jgi:hypothetical protein
MGNLCEPPPYGGSALQNLHIGHSLLSKLQPKTLLHAKMVGVSADPIPIPVSDFVARYIFSLEQLEVLLTLSGEPERAWSIAEIFNAIKSNEGSIANRLEQLVVAELVEKQTGALPRFRYSPATTALREAVTQTAAFYRLSPVRMIEMIFDTKRSPATDFADAFRLRKD